MRDALGREITYEYDALGRRTRTVFEDTTFTQTGYDDLGRRVAETDQAGKTRNFEYDDVGRLTAVLLPAVPDPENNDQPTRPRYEIRLRHPRRPPHQNRLQAARHRVRL
ncbi:MAG: hypothetical protein JXR37_27965 [Kiritimatiellae bacterium]|nr:hypothetical protein [Kiritimatiellia bacterium]